MEMMEETEEQATYSITLENLIHAQSETNGGGGGTDGETGGGTGGGGTTGGTTGGGGTGGTSAASYPSCVGGGCGALSCSISLKTGGGYTVSSSGATVGSRAAFSPNPITIELYVVLNLHTVIKYMTLKSTILR